MKPNRTDRINSLLKEVLSEVIFQEVKNPHLSSLVTVTRVEITQDLRQAKVYISVIGTEEEKESSRKALQSAAGFIAVHASKKVVMRFFPELTFYIDRTVDHQMKIDTILRKIHEEEKKRHHDEGGRKNDTSHS